MVRGIYTDFVEYRDSDLGEPDDPKAGTIYVVDTNVLLDLYKFTRSTADEVIAALQQMSHTLFVPHQVMAEFWGGVGDVRKGAHHREAAGKIRSSAEDSRHEVERWLKRTGLGPESARGADILVRQKAVAAAVEELVDAIESIQKEANDGQERIIPALEEAFEGRVGAAITVEQRKHRLAEFKARLESKLPPGFRDVEQRKGNAEKGMGDYLVWEECLEEGRRRSAEMGRAMDLTLITSDLKDDWTRGARDDGLPLAHRVLVREYAAASGGIFRIRTFRSLLDIAGTYFGAQVSEESKAQVEYQSQQAKMLWTSDAARSYLNSLWNRDHHDQLRVLITAVAAEEKGQRPLSLDEAREVARREKMSAFSGPYRTALQALAVVEAGIEEPMIELSTSAGVPSYVLAPVPIATVLEAILEDDDHRKVYEAAQGTLADRLVDEGDDEG